MANSPVIKIRITFYHPRHNQRKHRTFRLRNLRDETPQDKIAHARQILREVAAELRIISGGHGLLSGVVNVDGKAVVRLPLIEEYPAPERYGDFLDSVASLTFSGSFLGRREDGTVYQRGTRRTITIPCRAPSPLIQGGTRRVARSDPAFISFCQRFAEEGNLSVKEDFDVWGHLQSGERKMLKSVQRVNKRAMKAAKAAEKAKQRPLIYLIHMHDDIYKIGQSLNPRTRLRELQTSSPYALRLVHTFPASDATQAETLLHGYLGAIQLQGEWFRLSPRQTELLSLIDRYEGGSFWLGNEPLELSRLAARESE
jgi:hypothetical protein